MVDYRKNIDIIKAHEIKNKNEVTAMKFIHISDLHLGKRVNEFSMLEDQRDILKKILTVVDEEKPEAVFIAGDVYDKSIPPIEAIQLFDDFCVSYQEKSADIHN